MLLRFVVGCALTLLGNIAAAATFQVEKQDGKLSIIFVEGEFVAGDDEKFANLAISERSAIVFFNSPGGLAMVGTQIGSAIRLKGFATAVADGQMCASSCGLAWLAGSPRAIAGKGLVGFHAIHTIDNGRADVSSAGNALVGSYLQQLGLSYNTIVYVTKESPETMQWLSKEDANRLSLPVMFFPSDNPGGSEASATDAPQAPQYAPYPMPKPVNEQAGSANVAAQTAPANSPASPAPAVSWQILEHADIPGNDLPKMPIDAPSAEYCQAKCAAATGCVAYTQNIRLSKCFLKSGTSQALQFSGASSGYLGLPASVTRIGTDPGPFVQFRTGQGHEVIGPPIAGYRGATLAWCQDTCIQQSACQAFNYYPTGDCVLLANKKPTKVNPSVYAGFRTK